jgi:Na+/H+ antiporter NhaD/arsenite permease-like protein
VWIALCIFALTYLALAAGRVPGLRLDRTGAAIVGATLMIASNALTLRQAYGSISCCTSRPT